MHIIIKFLKGMSIMQQPKVLLTYIESGMGHIMSMRAIEDGLRKYQDQIEIIPSYIMQEEHNKTAIWFEEFLTNQTKRTNRSKLYSNAVFFIMTSLGKQRLMRLLHKSLFKKASDATIEAMHKYEPDVVVSTHYFITFCAIELKKRYLPNLTIITYNPDNNVHVWWDNRSGLFINNNEIACNESIKKRNFDYTQIRQVFFTARKEVIQANKSKEEYRKLYGIDDKFTIIIADGAYASGKAKSRCNALLKSKKEMNILLIAGKNEKVYQYFLKKAKKTKPNIHLTPLRFQEKIYELYAASDLFITKAGPNAMLDCCFMGTPIIVDYYAHPIEKATTKLFIDHFGCGIHVYKRRHILKEVEHLIEHPEILQQYRNNILQHLDKSKNGSDQIATIIMEEMKKEGKIA